MEEKIIKISHLILEDAIKTSIIASKAIIILIIGIWFAYFIAKKVKKIIIKTIKDEMLASFMSKISFVSVIIISIVATLGTIGVQTTSIITALGAAGLAIALALKDSLSNLSSGIMLIIFRPFTKGDTVDIGGHIGIIKDISIFHTYMQTPDGKLVIMPNTNVATKEVINFTLKGVKENNIQQLTVSQEVVRRIDWLVGVSYNSDIKKVKEIIAKSVENTDNIDKGNNNIARKVFIGVNELQASAIEFTVRAWVIDNDKFFKTKCDMIENVKNALDENNIEIPYNKLDVNIIK